MKIRLIMVISVAVLAGCLEKQEENTAISTNEIKQEFVCEVENWERDSVAQICQPGQTVAFLPKRWGNEQLPLYFVAVNCDLRYSVALTNGGAVCIYRKQTVANQ